MQSEGEGVWGGDGGSRRKCEQTQSLHLRCPSEMPSVEADGGASIISAWMSGGLLGQSEECGLLPHVILLEFFQMLPCR